MTTGPTLTVGQYSTAGLKKDNEDSYGVQLPSSSDLETKGIAMVIADGMSAAEAGKEASESCVKSFLIDYYCTHETLTVKTAVTQILSALNRWLYGLGQSRYSSSKGMVSTFSALVMKSGIAHIFHVGDSRIYRKRDGDFEQLTTDHRTWGKNGKGYLSRAVGIDVNLDVDYRAEAIDDGDIFVFTTDGVHDFVNDNQIALLIDRAEKDCDVTAKTLADMALENGSTDNITVQIVRIDDVGSTDESAHLKKLQHLPFPPDLETGMVLDGYCIQRELYASNRGQVYLAINHETGERVAIKTPSVNFEDDPVYLELFIREEWVGKRVHSPHVLKVINHVGTRHFLYTVCEYVDGQTLTQWMADNRDPDMQTVRDIISQIARGLRAFHRREMVHRDLKPGNILIDTHGTVKIIDFGSTKIAGLDEITSPITHPEMLGAVNYTAPEYHLNISGTKQADIFSLGVIMYQMLTGRLPYGQGFKNKNSVHRLKYTPAYQLNGGVPDWVDAALQKAVHPDPRIRYTVLSEFLVDISQPNKKFVTRENAPLLEKDPVLFWKIIAIGLFLLCIYLVID